MDLRATLACSAGACIGIALFYGAAGGSGRVKAAPSGSPTAARTAEQPRTVAVSGSLEPRSAESEADGRPGAEAPTAGPSAPSPLPAALRSRIFDALGGGAGAPLGERVVIVDANADPVAVDGLTATGVCLLVGDPADREAFKLAIAAVRGVAPSARLAIAGFQPGPTADAEAAEHDAALLASVDLLAVAAPSRADATAAERFFDAAGRHGRRVLALVEIPDAIDQLPAWRAAFRGATAAGVHVVLPAAPGHRSRHRSRLALRRRRPLRAPTAPQRHRVRLSESRP